MNVNIIDILVPVFYNHIIIYKEDFITTWIIDPRGFLMQHSQELSNNSYPEQNNPIARIDTFF